MADGDYAKMLYQAALALAMVFFTQEVLVLALATGSAPTTAAKAETQAPATEAQLTLRPSTPGRRGDAPSVGTLIIHFGGRFFDTNLKPLDPSMLKSEGELVVAIDPRSSAAEAMAVHARLSRPGRDLVVTTLDETWLNALQEMTR